MADWEDMKNLSSNYFFTNFSLLCTILIWDDHLSNWTTLVNEKQVLIDSSLLDNNAEQRKENDKNRGKAWAIEEWQATKKKRREERRKK